MKRFTPVLLIAGILIATLLHASEKPPAAPTSDYSIVTAELVAAAGDEAATIPAVLRLNKQTGITHMLNLKDGIISWHPVLEFVYTNNHERIQTNP